jgi:hypothetical protein
MRIGFSAPSSVRGEKRQQVDHRRVGALEISARERGMLGAAQERIGLGLEVVHADPRVGRQDAPGQRLDVVVVAGVVLLHQRAEPGVVAFDGGLPGLAVAQGGVGLGHLG